MSLLVLRTDNVDRQVSSELNFLEKNTTIFLNNKKSSNNAILFKFSVQRTKFLYCVCSIFGFAEYVLRGVSIYTVIIMFAHLIWSSLIHLYFYSPKRERERERERERKRER